MTRNLAADQNRAAFPFAAGVIDALRRQFGTGVRLVYAEENGATLGRKPDESRIRSVSLRDCVLDTKPKEKKRGR